MTALNAYMRKKKKNLEIKEVKRITQKVREKNYKITHPK